MDVIQKLNELRLAKDFSVYRLAELSGINQSTLANTFSRGTVPSLLHLEMLCDTLGITLSQFFAEDNSPLILSAQETELIENYRKLSPTTQRAVAIFLKDVSHKL